MENQKLFDFKKNRQFGDILTATFTFFMQEFKNIAKPIFYYITPVILVLFLISNYLQYVTIANMESIFDFTGTFISALSNTAIYVISYFLVSLLTMSYIKNYLENNGNTDIGQIKQIMKDKFMQNLGWSLGFFFFILLGFLLLIVPGVYFSVAGCLYSQVIFFEDESQNPIRRSFSLIKENWWFTLGLSVVMALIIYSIQAFLSMPLALMVITRSLHGIEDPSNFAVTSRNLFMFPLWYYIAQALINTVTLLLSIFPLIMLSIQYFNLKERKEMPSLIEQIEQM